jgi:RNA polymerase sigma-70 factor (ECF subfamily)
MSEDLELVERCQNGDVDAFRLLVERYQERIFNVACSIVGDTESARDVAQEAFIRAYKALPKFRGTSGFYTWLYRITVNVSLNTAQKEKKRHDSTSLDNLLESTHMSPEALFENNTPDSDFERVQLRETIQSVINTLSPDHRAVIVLKDIEGLSQEEIADILECSVGTVKSRLSRARNHLKEQLRPIYNEWIEGGLE